MKKLFYLTFSLCIFAIFISTSAHSEGKIGLYGFYLGQDIKEVLDNAAKKEYYLKFSGRTEIFNKLRQLPNGNNISSDAGGINEFPNPIIEVLGDKMNKVAKEFDVYYNRFYSQPDISTMPYVFFTLKIEENSSRPAIYIGMVWSKKDETMRIYQILINIFDTYNNDPP